MAQKQQTEAHIEQTLDRTKRTQQNPDHIPATVIAAVVATGLMSFCGVIVETSMNVTFPTLMRQFAVSSNVVQWMTSIYLLVVAVIVPLSAILKSSFTTRSLFTVASLFFFAGLITDALAPSFPLLLLGRALQGVGTGIALPLMFNIILEQVPAGRVGLMMGIGNLITGIAPAIGPTFGGIVSDQIGWRWVFWILLPFIALSFFLGQWGIRQKSTIRRQKVDVLSVIGILLLFTGFVYGFSNLGTSAFLSLKVGGALLVGLLGMALLVWRSLTIAQPVLKLSLLGDRAFAAHVLGFFLTQLISLGFAFLLPNYIQIVNGSTTLTAGLVVLPAGVAGAICAPLSGRVLDALGARKPIVTGISLCVASLVTFTLMSRSMSNFWIGFVYVFYMAGMGMCIGNVMTSGLRLVGPDDSAQGNAIMSTLQQFAGAMGTSVAAALVAASQKSAGGVVGRAAATAIGTQHAFLVLTVLAVVVLGAYIRYVRD
jgi:DHA2 family lincomycin resistance protein-like MFS transporter